MADSGKVYNVEHVTFSIYPNGLQDMELDDYWVGDNVDAGKDTPYEISGISDEGFGISPTAETEMVPGLKGFQGFSVDPKDGAEGSLALKSTASESLQFLTDLYNLQQAGRLPPFTIEVSVKDAETGGTSAEKAFGFQKKEIANAFFVNYAEFATDDNAAPDYEFEFIGYGYTEVGPEEEVSDTSE